MKKRLFLFYVFFYTFFCFPTQAESATDCIQTSTRNGNIHIAKINLNCKTVRLVGTDPHDKGLTVSEFAAKYQTQVAVNANFFAKNLTPNGLVITDKKAWKGSRDNRSQTFFACDGKNNCLIETKNQVTKIDPKWQIAVSGWPYYEQQSGRFECGASNKTACTKDIFTGKHPRTMLGLDEKNKLLYLVVVDGRQLTFRGMDLYELAELATELGVTKAINLDGGGSSTMVVNGERINSLPMLQSEERKVGNHLGVRITD